MPIRSLSAAVLVAAVLWLPGVPALAATLSFDHVSTQVTDVSPVPDGIIGPGDTFTLGETVLNNTLTPLSSLAGTLSATGGVSILQGASPFSVVAFGQQTTNTTLFRGNVPTSTECGANLDFSLGLTSGPDATTVPFTVRTGAAGIRKSYDSADVPRAIPDAGKVVSTLVVPDSGRVKDLRVRIGQITHPYVSDLTATVIAPDGTRVELFRGIGGTGHNFVNSVFGTTGSPISGSAPFTGSWRVDALNTLVGHTLQGTWKLEVADATNADTGTLDAWGLDLTPATCAAQPIASFVASPQIPAPGATFTLDASGSTDPVGTIVKYEWDLDGNGTYEVNGGASPTTTTSYPARGARTIGLRVTDNSNRVDVTTRTVSVTLPPIASFSATPAAPLSGQSTTLDASASYDQDVGGTIVRYEWDLDGNGTYETDRGAVKTVPTTFSRSGAAVVRLRVTDDDGATATATRTITVGNRPPIAALAPPGAVLLGASTTLDASGSSDPDGSIIRYDWDFDNNGSIDQTTLVPTVAHVFSAAGPVTVAVTVTDDATPAATATATRAFTVTRPPVAALSAAPNPARPGQLVTLDASGSSDPDGLPLAKIEWDLDGVPGFERTTGTTKTTTTSWALPGTYPVSVRVTDADGATDVKSLSVSVVNASPTALLSVTPNPVLTDQTVQFDASASSDPDGTIVKYEWDLDGNGVYELDTGTGRTTARTYPNPTVVAVSMRVTDNDGATATRTISLTVNAPLSVNPGPLGGGPDPGAPATPAPNAKPGGPSTTPGGTTSKPGSGGGGGGGPGGGGDPGATLAAGLTGAAIQPIATAVKRGVRIGCQSDRPAVCTVTAEVQPADAKRLRLVSTRGRKRAARPYTVGTATVNAAGAREAAIVIALPARLRQALKRQSSVLIVVRGTAADASGHRVALSRAVLIRR